MPGSVWPIPKDKLWYNFNLGPVHFIRSVSQSICQSVCSSVTVPVRLFTPGSPWPVPKDKLWYSFSPALSVSSDQPLCFFVRLSVCLFFCHCVCLSSSQKSVCPITKDTLWYSFNLGAVHFIGLVSLFISPSACSSVTVPLCPCLGPCDPFPKTKRCERYSHSQRQSDVTYTLAVTHSQRQRDNVHLGCDPFPKTKRCTVHLGCDPFPKTKR